MDTQKKKWFVVFRCYSKVLSKCRKCHFRDLKLKNVFGGESPRQYTLYMSSLCEGPNVFSHRGPHSRSAATVAIVDTYAASCKIIVYTASLTTAQQNCFDGVDELFRREIRCSRRLDDWSTEAPIVDKFGLNVDKKCLHQARNFVILHNLRSRG